MSESINILRDIEKYYTDEHHQCMTNFETADQYNELCKAQQSPTLFQKDLKEIRRAAKTHFTTDCDNLKLSTIHSFKGWEAETVILLLQPEMEENSTYEGYYIQERENTPALIVAQECSLMNSFYSPFSASRLSISSRYFRMICTAPSEPTLSAQMQRW